MATYLILNLPFLVAALIVWVCAGRRPRAKHVLVTLAVLIVCTAVFDSLIVGLGIVAYDTSKTLGLTIGAAPVEDFFYALLAGLLIPLIWTILGKDHDTL